MAMDRYLLNNRSDYLRINLFFDSGSPLLVKKIELINIFCYTPLTSYE